MSKASTQSAPADDPASAMTLSDDRLALSATKGDRRAFAAIYRRYHQELYRYCAAILGNAQDAQDAQDACRTPWSRC
jgi:DNA-directed RNA polymerase specialized sigma24 family protein